MESYEKSQKKKKKYHLSMKIFKINYKCAGAADKKYETDKNVYLEKIRNMLDLSGWQHCLV